MNGDFSVGKSICDDDFEGINLKVRRVWVCRWKLQLGCEVLKGDILTFFENNCENKHKFAHEMQGY